MSWPLASFAIVLGILLAGWLAYERSRPSARMVAVVATLAAVAALGRDAFVALPDVKPITAMALVVGYALGPIPGFTVGAVGMLASNILLGQGPYTPWQMVAWGLVGVAGALLGRLSGRRMGRLSLALSCALAAIAAKEIMNVYTWTIGASHTPAALLATAGSALAFDVTDAVASFLFGLAFAPELARLLGRMRARMEVEWVSSGPEEPARLPSGAVSLALVAVAVSGIVALGACTEARARPNLAPELSYLARAQNRDGGFGGAAGQHSSELFSSWAAIGLAAAGRDPLALRRGGHTVLGSILGQVGTLEGTGDVERTILALRACGAPIGAFPGDLVGKLLSARARDGSFGELVNITTFAIFALRAAGRPAGDPVVRAAGRWLAAQQGRDGGFGFAGRGGSEDVDDTAAALQGVIDAGTGGAVAARAVAFLRRSQNADGGYPQQPGSESNAQSTAWAVQGLIAAGRDANAIKRDGSRSPVAYLQSLVAPDGSVRYSRTSAQTPVWVTAQALTALAGRPFPVAPVPGSSYRGTSRVPTAAASPGPALTAAKDAARLGSHRSKASPSRGLASSADVESSRLATVARTVGDLIDSLLVRAKW